MCQSMRLTRNARLPFDCWILLLLLFFRFIPRANAKRQRIWKDRDKQRKKGKKDPTTHNRLYHSRSLYKQPDFSSWSCCCIAPPMIVARHTSDSKRRAREFSKFYTARTIQCTTDRLQNGFECGTRVGITVLRITWLQTISRGWALPLCMCMRVYLCVSACMWRYMRTDKIRNLFVCFDNRKRDKLKKHAYGAALFVCMSVLALTFLSPAVFSAMSLCMSCHRLLCMIYRSTHVNNNNASHTLFLCSRLFGIAIIFVWSPAESVVYCLLCGIDHRSRRRSGSFIKEAHWPRHSTLIQRFLSTCVLSPLWINRNEINKATVSVILRVELHSLSLHSTPRIPRDNKSEDISVSIVVYSCECVSPTRSNCSSCVCVCVQSKT